VPLDDLIGRPAQHGIAGEFSALSEAII
jgi:hypothetical protein